MFATLPCHGLLPVSGHTIKIVKLKLGGIYGARRTFGREFKVEAVWLVVERGFSIVQAARDLEIGESVLRRWVRELYNGGLSASLSWPGSDEGRAG